MTAKKEDKTCENAQFCKNNSFYNKKITQTVLICLLVFYTYILCTIEHHPVARLKPNAAGLKAIWIRASRFSPTCHDR